MPFSKGLESVWSGVSDAQLSLLIITLYLETNKIGTESYSIIPCCNIQGASRPALNTLIFFKVNDPELAPHSVKSRR